VIDLADRAGAVARSQPPLRSDGWLALVLAAAAATAVTCRADDAWAWCRTLACDPDGDEGPLEGLECVPAHPDPRTACGGFPLSWRRPCIGYALHERASEQVPLQTAREVLRDAFRTWEEADCGGDTPAVRVVELGTVECGEVEYNHGDGDGNINVVVFRDDGWPADSRHAGHVYALTTVSYHPETGDIVDADIEVNSAAPMMLTTRVDAPEVDLASILVHETGHFLGLGHSADGDATMYPFYTPGETAVRSLTADDAAGICAIYPPGSQDVSGVECNPLPDHGYASTCGGDQDHGSCSVAIGKSPELPAIGWSAASLVALLALCRRGARRRAR
jgi:hypothetical protein